jgi:NADPH:quinone reductase-like Zn-dependent oxidoreductase
MKVMELRAFGLDDAASLVAAERPVPRPAAGQLLLRLRAAALNYRDVEIAAGHYGMPVQLPRVPVSDGVGKVVEVGAGVTRFVPGDRAIPVFFPDWVDGDFHAGVFARQLGSSLDGVLAEYRLVHEAEAVKPPPALSDAAAASLSIAGLTAWNALVDARLQPGQSLLVIGTGGVAMAALQLAPLFGADSIVVSGSQAKLERLAAHGLARGVNRQRTPDWGQAVWALSGGRGVDLVLETGGATLPQSTIALRPGGQMAMVGYLAGTQVSLDLRSLFIAKRARLAGHTVGSRTHFEALLRALARHPIEPWIDAEFALADSRAALQRLAGGEGTGKVLIRF